MKCLAVSVIKAILTRVLFASHGFIATWRVVDVKEDNTYWLLMVPSLLLAVEFVITTLKTKGGEWKWFSPSVFLYLSNLVPVIWILEEDLLQSRLDSLKANNLQDCALLENLYQNDTSSFTMNGLSIDVALSEEGWVLGLQQVLMCSLILGRWLLPKGELTRDQLSQLLLVYIGMAADILEFSSESIDEDAVKCDRVLVMLILLIWSWSLLQFTLVLTATKARKPRVAGTGSTEDVTMVESLEEDDDEGASNGDGCLCLATEVWAIIISILMQDGPYLTMRLYLLIDRNAVNQMMLWFTTKNAMVLSLQIYRLVVLYMEKRPLGQAKKRQKEIDAIDTVSQITLKQQIHSGGDANSKEACLPNTAHETPMSTTSSTSSHHGNKNNAFQHEKM